MMHSIWLFFANLPPIKPGGLPTTTADNAAVHNILQIVLAIMGAMSLLVITVAGLRYITAAGDPQKTANAKNTIIYALVGLVIAISAEALITFGVTHLV